MKVLTRLAWGSAKFWLGAMALVAAALAVARDRAPANAVSTEILASLSSASSTWASTTYLVKSDGTTYGSTPCDAGFHNPATICFYIWAKGVANSTGASAFQVHLRYPDDRIAVSYVATSSIWLASTGRAVVCAAPVLNPGDALAECNTLRAPPPLGATGSGVLVKVAVSSKSLVGSATLDLSNETFLLDTPSNPNLLTRIPATVRSTNIFVAPCADMTADGIVKGNDILFVVRHFHLLTAMAADLDQSGAVTGSDILVVVKEFNWSCTA